MKRLRMTTSFLLRTPRFPVCVEPMAAVVPWTDCREWRAYAKSQIWNLHQRLCNMNTSGKEHHLKQYSEKCGRKRRMVLHDPTIWYIYLCMRITDQARCRCSCVCVCPYTLCLPASYTLLWAAGWSQGLLCTAPTLYVGVGDISF